MNRRVIERYTQRVVEAGGTPHERFAGPLLLPNDTTSLRNYFAQTSLIDDAVGRIMTALDENGLAEDTIVIYTADHGFSLGHHGIWGHGLAAWPSSMLRPSYHVPLVMAGPGIATADHDGLVSQIDIPNTLLHAAGAALIETDRHDSRVIALDDPGRPVRDALCIEQEEAEPYAPQATSMWSVSARLAARRCQASFMSWKTTPASGMIWPQKETEQPSRRNCRRS